MLERLDPLEPGVETMAEDIAEMTHGADKRVALLIAILALLLFLSEAGGKSAQHHSTEANIESSDLYNFYQAKRIRTTLLDVTSKQLDLNALLTADASIKDAMAKQSNDWKATAKRYESEPKEGMKELLERAKHAVEVRNRHNVQFEHYELASGLLQLAIVIASASIITGIAILIYLSGVLGLAGAAFMAFGFFAPTLLGFMGGH